MNFWHKIARAFLLIGLLAISGFAHAALQAGTVSHAKGDVTATRTAGAAALKEGDAIFEGDQLATGGDGSLVVLFKDETKFVLWHNTKMTVEKFADQAGEEGLVTRVTTGSFRFVSGLIAKRKPKSVSVKLAATATLGIRGTHAAGEISGERVDVMLLDPESGSAPSAIVVYNDHGSVDVEEPGYGTTVPDANSPPSPVQRMRLRNIENLMRSIQSSRRATMPRPVHHY